MVMNKTATSEFKNGSNYLTNKINEQSSEVIAESKIFVNKKGQYINEDTQPDETPSVHPNVESHEDQTFDKLATKDIVTAAKRSESKSQSNKNSQRSFRKDNAVQQGSNYQTQLNSNKRVNEKRSNSDLTSIMAQEPKMPKSNSRTQKFKSGKLKETRTPQQIQNAAAVINGEDYIEFDIQDESQPRKMIHKRSKSQISLVKGGKQLSNGGVSQGSGPSTGVNNTKLQPSFNNQNSSPINAGCKDIQSFKTNDMKTNVGSLRPFTRNVDKSFEFNPFFNEDVGLNIEQKSIYQVENQIKTDNLKVVQANNTDFVTKVSEEMTFHNHALIRTSKPQSPQRKLNVVSGPNEYQQFSKKQGIFAPSNSKLRGPSVPKNRPKPQNVSSGTTQQVNILKQTQIKEKIPKEVNGLTANHTEMETVLSDISHHVVLIQNSPSNKIEEISVTINTNSTYDQFNKIPTLRTTPKDGPKVQGQDAKATAQALQNPVLSPRPDQSSKLQKKAHSPFFKKASQDCNKEKLLNNNTSDNLKKSQEQALSACKKSSGKLLPKINLDLDGLTFPQPKVQKHSLPVQTLLKNSQNSSPINKTIYTRSSIVGTGIPMKSPQPNQQESEAEAYKSAIQAMNNLSKKMDEDQLITQAQINRSGTRGFFDRPKHQLIQQVQTQTVPVTIKNSMINGQSIGSMVTITSGAELMPPKISQQQQTSGIASPKSIINQLVHNNSSAQRILKKDDTLQMIQGGVGLLNQNSKTVLGGDGLSFNKENDFIPTMPKISAQTLQQQFLKRNQRIIYRDKQDAKTQQFIFANKESSNEVILKTNEKAFSQSFYNQPQYALKSSSRSNSKNEMPVRSPKRSEVNTANVGSKVRELQKGEALTARSSIPRNALPHLLQHTAYDAFEHSQNESNFRSTQKSGMKLVNQMLKTVQNTDLPRNSSNTSSRGKRRRIEVKNILANNKYFKKHTQPINVNDYKSLNQVLGFKSDINNLRNLNQPQTLLKTAVQQNQLSPKSGKVYVINKFELKQRSSNVGSVILQNNATITFDSENDVEDDQSSSEGKDTPTRNLSSIQTKYANQSGHPIATYQSHQQASIQQFQPGVNKLSKIAKLNQSPGQKQERETIIMRNSLKGPLTTRGSVPTIKQENIDAIATGRNGITLKNSLPEMTSTPQALSLQQQIHSFYDKRTSPKKSIQNEFINTQDQQTSRENLHTNADLVDSLVLQKKFNAIKLIKPITRISKEKQIRNQTNNLDKKQNYLVAHNFTSKTASVEGSNASGSAVKKNASYMFDKGPFKIEENLMNTTLQNNTNNELHVPHSSTHEQRSLDSSTNLTARMPNQKNEMNFQTESNFAEDSIVRIQEDSGVRDSFVKKHDDSLIQESVDIAETEQVSLQTPADTSIQLPARLSDFLKKPKLVQSIQTPIFEQQQQNYNSKTHQKFKINDQSNIMKVISNQHPLKRVLPLKNMPIDIVSSTNSRTNSPGRRGSAFSSTVHFQTVDDTFSSSFYNQQQIAQNQRAVFKIKAQAKEQRTKSRKSGNHQNGMNKTDNFRSFRPINSTVVQFQGLPNIQPKVQLAPTSSATSDYAPAQVSSVQPKNPNTARAHFRQTAAAQNWINAPQFSQPRLSATINGFPTQRTSKNFKQQNLAKNTIENIISKSNNISSPRARNQKLLKNNLASFGTLQTSMPSSPHATRNMGNFATQDSTIILRGNQNPASILKAVAKNSTQKALSKRRNISLNLQEKFVRQTKSQVKHTLSNQIRQEESPQKVTVGAVALQEPKNLSNFVLQASFQREQHPKIVAKATPIQKKSIQL